MRLCSFSIWAFRAEHAFQHVDPILEPIDVVEERADDAQIHAGDVHVVRSFPAHANLQLHYECLNRRASTTVVAPSRHERERHSRAKSREKNLDLKPNLQQKHTGTKMEAAI
jgi:hypothetical protein